ncbi:DUF2063 domain-containing protein [Acidithiobacillus marinus]|uniref:DUF2063 domain-containing protein n=1 Tax=Acidithiobacillus marinus TaxID=187490 RepID=A0A2I1DNR0_9PROT|nr:DNA-binding domain-containing protein [Acidithiobacillus marinus]PKY11508.1 DUF2063 domain-containing protein [Acidithiobacillus marinus]
MSTPFSWQASFMEAVLSEGGLIPDLDGPFSSAVSTAVYRNNILEGFTEGLKNIYGAIFLLIGEDCFRAIAHAYARSTPSLCGDRNAYGARMPEFLGMHPLTRSIAYLADVARLEWASHEAYLAAEEFMDSGLHTSVRLIESDYPLLALWQFCQHPETDSPLDLDALGGDRVFICRPQEEVLMRSLPMGEASWYRSLLEHKTLGEATSAAVDAEPGIDPAQYLASAQRDGIFIPKQ